MRAIKWDTWSLDYSSYNPYIISHRDLVLRFLGGLGRTTDCAPAWAQRSGWTAQWQLGRLVQRPAGLGFGI